eukprot:CAMPEP_0117662848 /NCGR_PEP_ID=MMETSP0804-20121206/8269_1 /TAXON_ID=1074897 /ORGANISM="Tetraselmis astigmatica, Strain CCMP880" /LENGTH=600 /DNA_ID=CAMNT_0005469769 /DNA_START=243 /DNA_END=2046 /DNA_ORIENTATION=-
MELSTSSSLLRSTIVSFRISLLAVACLTLCAAPLSHAMPSRGFQTISTIRDLNEIRSSAGRSRKLTAAEEKRSLELLSRCTVHFRNTTLNHFSWATPPGNVTTYSQRYFLCFDNWSAARGWPIFFYAGNEADVTLYLNNTGLMWESAPMFGAALVFAEHRYYGESLPFGDDFPNHLEYLTVDQAMADYAELIADLKMQFNCQDSAVIAFGGSYGGMLASWMRMKYPHIITGAIASSAPILSSNGLRPPYDIGSYAKVVTYDATVAAGSAPGCSSAVRSAWTALFDHGKTDDGRSLIRSSMGLCPETPLKDASDVLDLAYWLQSAMDFMAMGNYPYETSYITNGGGALPPFPMRVGCVQMMTEARRGSDEGLLTGLAKFSSIFYNASSDLHCLNYSRGVNPDTDLVGELWGYQECCDMVTPMSRDGVVDMFWGQSWDQEAFERGCLDKYGVQPRPYWAVTDFGGRDMAAASNIVFANGEYDPWKDGGVRDSKNPSIATLTIPEAAHHLDLMFSHPLDTDAVKDARRTQRQYIAKWIAEHADSAEQSKKHHTISRPSPSDSGMWVIPLSCSPPHSEQVADYVIVAFLTLSPPQQAVFAASAV